MEQPNGIALKKPRKDFTDNFSFTNKILLLQNSRQ